MSAELERAVLLARKMMSAEQLAHCTDESLRRMLAICERAGGLIVDDGFLFAYFRYWPSAKHAVADTDIDALEALELSAGPLLHIVAYAARFPSFSMVRDLITELNPWGVTCHRLNRRTGEFRLAAQKNRRWRGSGADQYKSHH